MILPEPPHSFAADYGQVTTLVILGLGFLYTLVRWPLMAFLLWGHRKLGEEAWKPEIERRDSDHIAILDAREIRLGILTRLTNVERSMEMHDTIIKELPEIKAMAIRACETADRTEHIVNDTQRKLVELGESLSEIKGFLQRGSDQFRQTRE